ncbi:hypothetical protein LRAMOSA09188 [Lichtheimia ramosa]|uniref:OB domain-containing protein n=1 Tax=Lichtheimia ramosa TaxID=688394 RepID=A0A077WGC3_9FUNG|nr:hypothetical protein LRAMOSA09188 [Lichtheimia ramosa]
MEWDNGENSSNVSNLNKQQQHQQTKNTKVQTIRPVTIKQVAMARAYEDGSVVFIDDKEISTIKITFIGVIRSCESSSTGYTYMIEDGTGFIRVRQWDTEEEETVNHVNVFRQVNLEERMEGV